MTSHADFDTFMELSSYLLGVPMEGLAELDPVLGRTFFTRIQEYVKDPEATTSVFGASAVPPPGGASGVVQPGIESLESLLDIWRRLGPAPTTGGGAASQFKKEFDAAVFQNDSRPDISALAQKVIFVWYGAQIDSVPLDATTYDRALVWSLSWAHPQAVPRSFGYWQYSPEAVATGNPPGISGDES